VLLTGVVLLACLVNRQGRLPGCPVSWSPAERNLPLLGVVFVAIHVITAVLDPYVTIQIARSWSRSPRRTSPCGSAWADLTRLGAGLILTSLAGPG